MQHSMLTKSIERAQRKVEENNFGIRKRLLEYDDVMNSQRTVIYTKRKNALFGERLDVDLNNTIFDVVEDIVAEAKEGGSIRKSSNWSDQTVCFGSGSYSRRICTKSGKANIAVYMSNVLPRAWLMIYREGGCPVYGLVAVVFRLRLMSEKGESKTNA
ncbi:hypothetical protein FQR65_LT18027 [Abscondita terminalis]|nr:hypothetical protein FQR65_LT18027 [Abscondita terminalis]